MFDWFKKKPKKVAKENVPPKAPPAPPPKEKTEKELFTERGEPWVQVLRVDVDPENLHQGSFELDWNEYFIAKLVKAGYMKDKNDTDRIIIDRWFQDVCKNVVAENYEQWEANQPYDARPRVLDKKDLGDGRTEIG
mgnify:CR=1 FL=1